MELKNKKLERLDGVINTIANHYGLTAQLDIAAEESAELIKACMKYKRDSNLRSKNNLIEEIADVLIMTRQLIKLLDIENEVIETIDSKTDRQIRRILLEIQKLGVKDE